MLQSITIQNYALIDKLDITFEKGFTTITGETGAGKSIIIGAIGLLLGQRADSKSIKAGKSRCTVEATFLTDKYHLEPFFEENDLEYDGTDCIVRREVNLNGKSRGFINDTPVSLAQLKELGDKLIDIHSQHQNLLLNNEEFQLEVVDMVANHSQLYQEYQKSFQDYQTILTTLDKLEKKYSLERSKQVMVGLRLNQIQRADLKPNDQVELEENLEKLKHSEDIKEGFFRIAGFLNEEETGIIQAAKKCMQILNILKDYYPKAKDWGERMENCFLDLKDMADDIEKEEDSIDFDNDKLEYINNRLDTIYSIEERLGVKTVPEILEKAKEFSAALSETIETGEQIEILTKEKDKMREKANDLADMLTAERKVAAEVIEKEMVESLKPLGMPNIQFKVAISPREKITANGKDKVSFLFTANKNGKMEDVATIASGGEIARVMLSLKALIANTVQLPTIIFDEIDTGVSGDIAERMARIMQSMGQNERQIISITHLPQIAALGSVQYKVYKKDDETETTSHIIRLTNQERIEEIAQMLSGSTLTDAAVENAKELLKHAAQKK